MLVASCVGLPRSKLIASDWEDVTRRMKCYVIGKGTNVFYIKKILKKQKNYSHNYLLTLQQHDEIFNYKIDLSVFFLIMIKNYN